jgi:hypothetical protein
MVRRREKQFTDEMQAVGRLLMWAQARSQIDEYRGTLIDERVPGDDVSRLWWTPEDVSALSPHPYCPEGDKPADSEGCRSAFRTDVDHRSEVMSISIPN